MAEFAKETESIHLVAGVNLAAVAAHIRYPDRLDLVLIEIEEGASCAGVFTQNAFRAAPVQITMDHLQKGAPRYFLINTGNANAGTGEAGIKAARDCCKAVADRAGIDDWQVHPFSTGVIGEQLPTDKIVAGLPAAFDNLGEANWQEAATGILTTDTCPKLASVQVELGGEVVTITGMAKGAGMLKPNMATMLAYVFTDANIESGLLQQLLNEAVSQSFNRLTVDGDTSTNDCCMLVATAATNLSVDAASPEQQADFKKAMNSVFLELATGLIRDAEGASKFVTVQIEGGASQQECLQVAYCVAESPLVKTAIFASDPNWGRILAAVGRAGLNDLAIDAVTIHLGDVLIVSDGGVAETYTEESGQNEMDKQDIVIKIDLARGQFAETVWTSDLSHEYVRINAEYRT